MNYDATGVPAYTGNNFSTASVRDVLKASVYAVSHLTGLELDKELFSDRLPLKLCDAACCSIAGEHASEQPGVRCFLLKICARGSFDSCTVLNKIKSLTSFYGRQLFLKISGGTLSLPVTVQTIVPASDWKSIRSFYSGVAVPHLTFDILVYIAPERPEQ